jgi:L-asparaginase II
MFPARHVTGANQHEQDSMMHPAVLADVTRGGFAESVHMGSIAVVHTLGELLHCAGDPHVWTFTRSALKPFQAMPCLLSIRAARRISVLQSGNWP